MSQTAPQNMSPEAMRVEIAKDALAQVRAEKFIPSEHNGYATFDQPINFEFGDELQKHLTDDRVCYGCARGALFLSIVRRHDNFKVDGTMRFDRKSIHTYCRINKEEEFFTPQQLHAIESAYEGYDQLLWCRIYRDPKDRLIAILENIIRNNGTFVPTETTAEAVGV